VRSGRNLGGAQTATIVIRDRRGDFSGEKFPPEFHLDSLFVRLVCYVKFGVGAVWAFEMSPKSRKFEIAQTAPIVVTRSMRRYFPDKSSARVPP
jgi:hypothetical protein